MMVRSTPSSQTSFRGVAVLAGSLAAIGVGIFAVATKAEEQPSMLTFLARAQSEANAQRVGRLINAITDVGAHSKSGYVTTVSKTVATKAVAQNRRI